MAPQGGLKLAQNASKSRASYGLAERQLEADTPRAAQGLYEHPGRPKSRY
jgi:hypothetical protein